MVNVNRIVVPPDNAAADDSKSITQIASAISAPLSVAADRRRQAAWTWVLHDVPFEPVGDSRVKITPQNMQALGVIPFWTSVALIGFVAYHSPQHMKYFLAMNILALANTMIVLGAWLRRKLSE